MKKKIAVLVLGLAAFSGLMFVCVNSVFAQLGGVNSSIYSVIGNDGFQNGDTVRRLYHFMQWNHNDNKWDKIETQIIKNGDELIQPGEPASALSSSSTDDDEQFSGWVVTNTIPDAQGQDVSGGTSLVFGEILDINESATEDETVYVYANFKRAYKAAFFDRQKSEGTPGIVTVLNSASYADGVAIDVSKITESVQTADGKAVTKWYIYVRGDNPFWCTSVPADDKTSLKFSEIQKTIFLYPEISDSHVVTFDKNDSTTNPNDKDTKSNASFTNSAKVAEGVTINKPKDPTRDGYTFGGWYESRDFSGDPVDFATKTYSSDTTLYAKWTPKNVSFRVILWTETFDTEIGKTTETRPGRYYSFVETNTGSEPAGTTIENRADAERIFNKLFTTVQIKSWFPYHETPDLSDIDGELFIAGDGSTIFNVYFDLKTYTLTFNLNNGVRGTLIHEGDQAGTYYDSEYKINVKIGQDISRLWPTAQEVQDVRSGWSTYVFRGWTRSGVSTYFVTKRDKMVEELLDKSGSNYVDTTFTASYGTGLIKDYVQYYLQKADGDGYELSSLYTEYINANRNSSMQPKEIEGFTFRRNGQNNGRYDSNLKAYVYAFYYDRNESKIEFINYGEIDKEIDGILHGADISGQYYVPRRPTALEEYYTFDGWYLDQYFQARFDENGSFAGKTMHKDNLALYAKWKKNNITITFDGNGGTIDGDNKKEYSIEAETRLAEVPGDPSRGDTWEFLGWYDEDNNALDATKPFTKNTTFIAKWKSIEKFSIKYELPNDESGEVREDVYSYYDGAVTSINKFSTPQSRDGYNFLGWEYKVNPDGKIYHENEMIEVDAERAENNIVWLKAVYDKGTPILTSLIFDGNGGDHGGETSVLVDAAVSEYGNIQNNEWTTLASDYFSYTGKRFVEWNTAADGGGIGFDAEESIGVDATDAQNVLYAIWENDVPDTVNYKVKHYLEIADQSSPASTDIKWNDVWYSLTDTDLRQSEVGATVTASQKVYSGFHFNTNSIQTGEVTQPASTDPSDETGMLVLELYYNRDERKYYVDHLIESVDQSNPGVGAVQVNGVWYELAGGEREEKTGIINTVVSAEPKTGGNYAHFIYNGNDSTASGVVSEDLDNPLVLRLLYNREVIKIYYRYEGIVPADAMPSQAQLDGLPSTALYGSTFDSYKGASDTQTHGHTFDGWYFDKDCTNPVGAKEITESFTVYGKFVPRTNIQYGINVYYQVDGVYPNMPDKTISKTGSTGEIVVVDDEYLVPDQDHQNMNYQLDQERSVISGTLPRRFGEPLRIFFKQEFALSYLKGTNGRFIDVSDDEEAATGRTYFPNISYGTLGDVVAYNGETDEAGKPLGKNGSAFLGWVADVDIILSNSTVIPVGEVLDNEIVKSVKIDRDIKLTAQWEKGDDEPEEDDGDEKAPVPDTGANTAQKTAGAAVAASFIGVFVALLTGAVLLKIRRK